MHDWLPDHVFARQKLFADGIRAGPTAGAGGRSGWSQGLVGRKVSVIVAALLPAARAAKSATATIPIVFISGSDPIESQLVTTLSRRTENVTGVSVFSVR